MTDRSPEELARALAAAERKAAELQAWVDSSEAEADQLRARVAELEAAPPPAPPSAPSSAGQLAELQAWLDSAEAEADALRARVAELEAAPPPAPPSAPSSAGQLTELQAWLDAAEEEGEQLKAKVAQLEQQVQASSEGGARQAKEAEAWLKSSEDENEALREQLKEETKALATDERKVKELQDWLDASEAENEKLQAQLAGTDVQENRWLRERVSELESASQSLKEMNKRFSEQVEAAARRDVERLTSELDRARASGAREKVGELEFTLSNAREAISTLESERAAALAQVQRYASRDSALSAETQKRARAELEALRQEKDARITVLQASLGAREGELKLIEQRLSAYVGAEEKQQAEYERVRRSDCDAREQLAHVRDERDRLQSEKAALEHQAAALASKLEETKRWLETSERENQEGEKKREALQVDLALRTGALKEAGTAAAAAAARASRPAAGPGAPAEPGEESLEGFSLARLHRLEALLATEQERTARLERLLRVAEKSVLAMQDELDFSRGRFADLVKRLGSSDAEAGEALDRLDQSRRELAALRQELETGLAMPVPPPPPLDAFDDTPPPEEDVLSAPLDAVEALAESQAAAARQATQALAGEQRAREQLVNDLGWLKAELEKLTNVRDELKQRLGAMVQREVQRKGVVGSLLAELRKNEVATAARAGALRRLQAAIELAQRTAVKVQTIYFQKQIGSLQRQLEVALGRKKAPAPAAPAPVRLKKV